jgi:enamine deaminase RidA (YjgF/YER057c/UK114 family)
MAQDPRENTQLPVGPDAPLTAWGRPASIDGHALTTRPGRRIIAGHFHPHPREESTMATAAHREEIWVPGMPEPISHFVHVVRAGRLVFVSGCVASDDQGRTVGGSDIVAQTRQVHENIKRCLAAVGATFGDVCKVTVYLKIVAHREAVNTVRKEYFGASRPASTLIEISQFVRPDLLIEIEAVAVLPEKKGGARRGKTPASRPARKAQRRRR